MHEICMRSEWQRTVDSSRGQNPHLGPLLRFIVQHVLALKKPSTNGYEGKIVFQKVRIFFTILV